MTNDNIALHVELRELNKDGKSTLLVSADYKYSEWSTKEGKAKISLYFATYMYECRKFDIDWKFSAGNSEFGFLTMKKYQFIKTCRERGVTATRLIIDHFLDEQTHTLPF